MILKIKLNKIKLNKIKKLNHSVMHHNRISVTAAHEDSDPENSHVVEVHSPGLVNTQQGKCLLPRVSQLVGTP